MIKAFFKSFFWNLKLVKRTKFHEDIFVLLYGRLPLANQTASTLDLSDLSLTMPLHSEDNEEQPNNGHQNRKHESFRRSETKHDSSKNIVFMEERKILVIPTVEQGMR